jgi:hypothetical protein
MLPGRSASLSALFAAASLLLPPTPTHACDACQSRLVDPLSEPPPRFTPDFAESTPVAPSPVPRQPKGPATPATRQPSGALSGRIVFTNAGHGWTWTTNWRLQRGITQEMNEDMGNLDQMNAFAAWCFNAGAVVVPMRPLGQQRNEVVLDNDDQPRVTFSGTWADSTSPIFFGSPGDLPYRYAALSPIESATATYTPNIPEPGLYPVYTWVRHGSDRSLQLYRIRHAGGETEVRIPHHMVGNGWVYLGEYFFNSGSNPASGSVIISNQRSSPDGTYAFADAIRFGNGMGSVNRGTGTSSYPREEESCRYWIQAHLGQGQSDALYDGGGNDESDSWSAPPKWSAEMNREQSGNSFKRIHLSFHSNAGGGRGAIGLITSTPTTNQARFAQLCGTEVNADLAALGSPPLEVAWPNRSTSTFTGGYSEIDGSLFNQEMDATILEVAFHDSADDARLLRDPHVRSEVGKSALHAIIRFMNQFDGGPLAFPPNSPSGLRARASSSSSITLDWSAPQPSGGSGTPASYVIYRSQDGFGFGNPITTPSNATSFTISGLTPGSTWFFRVAAANTAGESFPSETAASRTDAPGIPYRVLIVNAFDRDDRSLNLRQSLDRQAYAPPSLSGPVDRVLPRLTNASNYAVPHARALAAAGVAFDSCQNEHISSGLVPLSSYPILIWACGQESTADETFSTTEQSRISAFRASGGHLFVSGSEIAWDLDRSSGPTTADRAFLNSQLHADLPSDAATQSGTNALIPSPNSIFSSLPLPLSFGTNSPDSYPVQSPDILVPTGPGTSAALQYQNVTSGAAAIQFNGSDGTGRIVFLGFPFESISGESTRAEIMRRSLDFLSSQEILVPTRSPWRYLDTAASPPPPNWSQPSFNDASWPLGLAQLGFGDGDETTLLAPDPTRITTWFRHSFNLPNAAAFSALRLRLLRDDAALVFLNGHEISRSNLPDTPITFSTQALSAVTGPDESSFFLSSADSRFLRSGPNSLAVQIHQAGTTSSDLSFDLELSGSLTPPPPLVPSGSIWKFRDTGIAPSPSWITPAYDDTAWKSGPARLGYGGDGELTLVSNGGNPDAVHPVTWLRHSFSLPDASTFDALQLDLQRDDGILVFLNGTEILRDNLPAGPLSPNALASSAISGPAESAWSRFLLPSSALRSGPNLLAVQLHQSAPNSSDLGFDLRLTPLPRASIPFSSWQSASFGSDASNPSIASPLADPDFDSLPNLLEFALGSSPSLPDTQSWPLISTTSNSINLSFPRAPIAATSEFSIQSANSPAGPWSTLASSLNGNPFDPIQPNISISEPPTGPQRLVSISLPFPTASRQFFRLAVRP